MVSLGEAGAVGGVSAFSAAPPRVSLQKSASNFVSSWVMEPIKLEIKRAIHAQDLSLAQDNLAALKRAKFVLISTMRNETFRMQYFLDYYRKLGFEHFVIIDNQSDDGLMGMPQRAGRNGVFRARQL